MLFLTIDKGTEDANKIISNDAACPVCDQVLSKRYLLILKARFWFGDYVNFLPATLKVFLRVFPFRRSIYISIPCECWCAFSFLGANFYYQRIQWYYPFPSDAYSSFYSLRVSLMRQVDINPGDEWINVSITTLIVLCKLCFSFATFSHDGFCRW